MTVLPDGKILAAGAESFAFDERAFSLVRLNKDGSVDPSFGQGGQVATQIGQVGGARSLAVQPNRRVISAGFSFDDLHHRFTVVRYLPSGALDASFGDGGVVLTYIGDSAEASSVQLQPDGRIVVAGFAQATAASSPEFAVARYMPNGSLDGTFGSGGVALTSFGGFDYAKAVVVQPDGKIVAAGLTGTFDDQGNPSTEVAVARYTRDGELDPAFGVGGKATTGSFTLVGRAVALQPDRKIIVAGASGTRAQGEFALVRFTRNGSLDSTFGTGGVTTTEIGQTSGPGGARAIVLQRNGKILAAGTGGSGFALARYFPAGSLDLSFGKDGVSTVSLGSGPGSDAINALGIQPDQRIVAAGQSGSGKFAFARYLGDDSRHLSVRRGGSGKGRVNSTPAIIQCGKRCSAWFAPGTAVKLVAQPAKGSAFIRWSGPCKQEGRVCRVGMTSRRVVVAIFSRCVVPKLRGKPLARAKRLLRRSMCSVGRVNEVASATVRSGRVISTDPKAGTSRPINTKVRVLVSLGQ